jgi:hypothetical protein
MVSIFKDTIKSTLKEFEYTQSKIRSDKDVLKKGGHVTLNFRDKRLGYYWSCAGSITINSKFYC